MSDSSRHVGLRERAVAEFLPRVLVVYCLLWALVVGLVIPHFIYGISK